MVMLPAGATATAKVKVTKADGTVLHYDVPVEIAAVLPDPVHGDGLTVDQPQED